MRSRNAVLTGNSAWMKRCRCRRIETQPKNLSSGLSSGPVISFCGCGLGRHSVPSASCVSTVGTAPAHDRAGRTRDKCGACTGKKQRNRRFRFGHRTACSCSHSLCGCNLCSVLWPGLGDGRGIGDPGQLDAAGDIAANGLLSGWDCMYAKLGPGELAMAIGLCCGFNGDDGIMAAAALGDGCGICWPVGEVMLKLG